MIRIRIHNAGQQEEHYHDGSPLELGRGPQRQLPRLRVADQHTSRDQLRIEAVGENCLRVTALSDKADVKLRSGERLRDGEARELPLPVELSFGRTQVKISLVTSPDGDSFASVVPPFSSISRPARSPQSLGASPSPLLLADWFETLISVQRAAAGSDQFYAETVKGIVDLIGLDRGLVIMQTGSGWRVIAEYVRRGEKTGDFSRRIAACVARQQCTLFQQIPDDQDYSLLDVEAVVAAPVFGRTGDFVGLLYGARQRGRQAPGVIHPLEAQLVQVLAAAVSTGLARMDQEVKAAAIRARFEQFCSAEVAAALELDPQLLEGRLTEISVMFADVRRFSRIAERLGPEQSYRLLADTMDCFAECVLNRGGVIVDYYGDGLCAMWNAPCEQPDHADRACLTALDLVAALPELSDRWRHKATEPLEIGIGVNSGEALVGNAGSRRRIKYGPRGHLVNVASRVEGATKQFGVRLIVTAATRARLNCPLSVRRLGRVRMAGMTGDVELFELQGEPAEANWHARADCYRQALALFESNQPEETLDAIDGSNIADSDGPLQFLRRYIERTKVAGGGRFEPVIVLDAK
ncbi:MAG: adenylate/guanylate cyclase domain-containing protein [Planctomycetia bacterium]|nr:adenylate/guanylate cyclase domain-containing protein [Planctomycetia bacterium]